MKKILLIITCLILNFTEFAAGITLTITGPSTAEVGIANQYTLKASGNKIKLTSVTWHTKYVSGISSTSGGNGNNKQ